MKMEGLHDYCKLFTRPYQFGRLYILPGSHARGQTLHIFVIKKSHIVTDDLWSKGVSVEVFGVVSGQPGRTEKYGWLKQGPWVRDFEDICVERRRILKEKSIASKNRILFTKAKEARRIADFLRDY